MEFATFLRAIHMFYMSRCQAHKSRANCLLHASLPPPPPPSTPPQHTLVAIGAAEEAAANALSSKATFAKFVAASKLMIDTSSVECVTHSHTHTPTAGLIKSLNARRKPEVARQTSFGISGDALTAANQNSAKKQRQNAFEILQ